MQHVRGHTWDMPCGITGWKSVSLSLLFWKQLYRFSRVKCHVARDTGTSHVLQLKVPKAQTLGSCLGDPPRKGLGGVGTVTGKGCHTWSHQLQTSPDAIRGGQDLHVNLTRVRQNNLENISEFHYLLFRNSPLHRQSARSAFRFDVDSAENPVRRRGH